MPPSTQEPEEVDSMHSLHSPTALTSDIMSRSAEETLSSMELAASTPMTDSKQTTDPPVSPDTTLMAVKASSLAKNEERASNQEPTLLGITAELRNTIWELALTKRKKIVVTRAFKEPPLLSVCRQIRSEAKGIFLDRNRFRVDVLDCNATVLRRFTKFVGDLKSTDTALEGGYVFLHLTSNWDNLLQWCRWVWEGEVTHVDQIHPNELGPYPTYVMVTATSLAKECADAGTNWDSCKRMLAAVRIMAGRLDRGWLEGGNEESNQKDVIAGEASEDDEEDEDDDDGF